MKCPLKYWIPLLSVSFFVSCKPKQQTTTEVTSYKDDIRNVDYHCRKGTQKVTRLCVKSTKEGRMAVGPFPKAMVDACLKKNGDKVQCTVNWMPESIAHEVRGTGYCPLGTYEVKTFCQGKEGADQKYVFGPFSKAYVSRCHKLGMSSDKCMTLRWSIEDAQKVLEAAIPGDTRPSRLADIKKQPPLNAIEKKLGKTYCERYWDTNYYADYTIIDHHYNPPRPLPDDMRDRTLEQTLQGRDNITSPHPFLRSFDIGVPTNTTEEDVCNNAKILKKCFVKSLADDENTMGGKIFLKWANQNQFDPARLKMAVSAQETNLGWWINQGTNGVGIMQLAQPLTLDGFSTFVQSLDYVNREPIWRGITHNILTNIRYGTHMLADKINQGRASSLYNLAYHYNGGSDQVNYANNVVAYYDVLGRCGL